eukprot:521685-Prorocentrum_lima.AAC.1
MLGDGSAMRSRWIDVGGWKGMVCWGELRGSKVTVMVVLRGGAEGVGGGGRGAWHPRRWER